MTLRHTSIRVADVEATVEFYADLVGYEVLREFETDDGTRNVFVGDPADEDTDDPAALQLVAADDPVDTGDFEHVAVTVDDVDAALDSLDDDRIDDGPITMEEFSSRVAFITAPEGWGVELVEDL
ncbi:VOC family protein [Halosimplex litoreum]|uniref:VOC family protein n=1 Tax=Halosimplex litoreum TaxID=1198301 RepID=A0A7T3KU86_9EURY|nr:VOC family protein [Halosimplex litoreum]QPV61693.1 VOC family protein [Halosimplex litoreum]